MQLRKVVFAALMAAAASGAQAAVKVFNFSGTIGSSSIDGVADTLVGQSVFGKFSYDADLTPTDYLLLNGTQVGERYLGSTQIDIQTPLGLSTGTGNLIVQRYNPLVTDQFDIAANVSDPFYLAFLQAIIPARVLNGLPTDFTGISFRFTLLGTSSLFNGQNVLAGVVTVDAPTATDVPEPASWAMMVAGFGLVGTAMRRQGRPTFRFA